MKTDKVQGEKEKEREKKKHNERDVERSKRQ